MGERNGRFGAIYAAVVATGALALEVRRWFESGPRILVRADAGMTMVGGREDEDETDLLMVVATNRGDQPATVTHMVILEYATWYARIRNQATASYIILHPQPTGHPPIIPKELPPGGQWMGLARSRPDVLADIETGNFWAGIHTTAQNKLHLARIRKKKPEPAGTPI